MKQHILPIRVYYADTDASGIVHHSNYLNFFERGRTESLRQYGINLVNLYSDQGVYFVVHSIKVSFLQSARLDQLLYVVTTVEKLGHASIFYNQKVHLESPEGPLLCSADLRIACVNRSHKACALPDILIKEITK